jgi:hypothetical protein
MKPPSDPRYRHRFPAEISARPNSIHLVSLTLHAWHDQTRAYFNYWYIRAPTSMDDQVGRACITTVRCAAGQSKPCEYSAAYSERQTVLIYRRLEHIPLAQLPT